MRQFPRYGWTFVFTLASMTVALGLMGTPNSSLACAAAARRHNDMVVTAYAQLQKSGAVLQPRLQLLLVPADNCITRAACACNTNAKKCNADVTKTCIGQTCVCGGFHCRSVEDCAASCDEAPPAGIKGKHNNE